ncbi:GNAT family N-acetyltransferase [Paenibacillus sp. ACRRX]|uniref:GNAT family N-acetyltransferase n=1 Tax=Paenibacillus sp. ACRRX TaxID=2918206 RepID=UPI001EF63D4A|nr:GNAT family N-acetyltransferase [Paenibacillus sp. ACRRX]MCG7409628.1 GNAT family N-acetyltransferase [Paenibacillus sp. ACRRX]
MYVGEYNGEAVSIGSLLSTENSVGIYDIATRQEYRGKGLGSAMFHYLLEEAKRMSDGICVLQASPEGLGIYKRAGCKEVSEVIVYGNRHLIN